LPPWTVGVKQLFLADVKQTVLMAILTADPNEMREKGLSWAAVRLRSSLLDQYRPNSGLIAEFVHGAIRILQLIVQLLCVLLHRQSRSSRLILGNRGRYRDQILMHRFGEQLGPGQLG
jgi:hypothetical protein